MNRTPASNIHSRARRSPALPIIHSPSPAADDHHDDPRSKAKMARTKQSLQRAFVKCGILSLLVELLMLRSSMEFYTAEVVSTMVPLEVDEEEVEPSTVAPRRNPSRPDGTFHGYPVYYRNVSMISKYTKPYTLQNCLGENFQPDSWMRRSCHFKFFCFNMTSRQFQVYPRLEDQDLLPSSQQVPFLDVSATLLFNGTLSSTTTSKKPAVSLGGINLKWGKSGVRRLQWFPQVMSTPPLEFYALPPDVVMIPFHSLGGWNPGHAIWDDFLPMYTLTQLFQLPTSSILAIRYHLDDGQEGLWASCEAPERVEECGRLQNKFWALFNNQTSATTQQTVVLDVEESTNPAKTDLVCAKNGLAGFGDLTDHGTQKYHGWREEDYQSTHNHGRGGMFWKFRNFCLENLGLATNDASSTVSRQHPPYRIVLSMQSSDNNLRVLSFGPQYDYLAAKLRGYNVEITTVVLKNMTALEQVRLATETTIFITVCGGGAVTATFLPKGATAILYYHEHGGQKHNQATHLPARLDWDLFNHLSYLHVHWFPIQTMNSPLDLNLLVMVVRDALDRITLSSSTAR